VNASGSLHPLEVIEGKIQSKIAQFLSLKEPLINLKAHPSISIQDRAVELLAMQKILEEELANVLINIEQFKSGAWNFGEVAQVGDFANRLFGQISDVQKLQQQVNQSGPVEQPSMFPEVPIWAWGVGGFFVLKFLRIL